MVFRNRICRKQLNIYSVGSRQKYLLRLAACSGFWVFIFWVFKLVSRYSRLPCPWCCSTGRPRWPPGSDWSSASARSTAPRTTRSSRGRRSSWSRTPRSPEWKLSGCALRMPKDANQLSIKYWFNGKLSDCHWISKEEWIFHCDL